MVERREKEKWHVGKEIPIAVIIGFVVQAAIMILGGVWWFASYTSTQNRMNAEVKGKLDEISNQIAAVAADSYTKKEAEKDKELMNQKYLYLNERVNRIEIYGRRK